MKRAILGAVLGAGGLLAAASPALAQYYPYPPQRGGGYYEQDPRGHWATPGYGGSWGGGYYYPRPRPVIIGNVCATSRGACGTRPRPIESPCSCFFPGFGPKRGAVVGSQW